MRIVKNVRFVSSGYLRMEFMKPNAYNNHTATTAVDLHKHNSAMPSKRKEIHQPCLGKNGYFRFFPEILVSKLTI